MSSTFSVGITKKPIGMTSPVETLDNQTRSYRPPPQKWVSQVKEWITKFALEQRDLDWARYEKYVINERAYRGQKEGRVSPITGSFRSRVRKGKEVRYTHNFVRSASRNITAQWTLANIELTVEAMPGYDAATDHDVGAARFAERILEYQQRRQLSEIFKQRECQLGQFTGNLYRYSDIDPDSGPMATRPMYGIETIQSPDMYECPECQHGGIIPPGESKGGECENCGNTDLVVHPGGPIQMPAIQGYKQVCLGQPFTLAVPGYQLRYDRVPNDFEHILWLCWQVRVRPESVAAAFPNWKKSSGTGDFTEAGVRAEITLKRSVGNYRGGSDTYGWGTGSVTGPVEPDVNLLKNWWFMPEVYWDYTMPDDLHLGNGDVVAKGTKADDYFKKGLQVMVMDDEPLDHFDKSIRDHWCQMPFFLVASQIDGDGYEDVIHPAREIDLISALQMKNMQFACGTGVIYRSDYIDRADLPMSPDKGTPIKPNAPSNMALRDIAARLERAGLPPEVEQNRQQRIQEIMLMLAANPQLGVPNQNDPQTRTATDSNNRKVGAQSQRAPELANYAWFNARWGQQQLKLVQENYKDEQAYITFEGKAGQPEAMSFRGTDIPQKFIVGVRSRSYIPRSEDDKRSDFMGFLQAFGGVQGLVMAAQAAPDLVETAMERFNVEVDFGHLQQAAREGRLRIDTMMKAAQSAQQRAMMIGQPQAAPMLLMQIPGVAPDQDDPHPQLITYYSAWKLTDEGRRCRISNPIIFQAVSMALAQHKKIVQQMNQPQRKPPSENIAFKDMTPEGKIQMAQQAGIQLNPQSVMQDHMLDVAERTTDIHAKAAAATAPGGPAGPPKEGK